MKRLFGLRLGVFAASVAFVGCGYVPSDSGQGTAVQGLEVEVPFEVPLGACVNPADLDVHAAVSIGDAVEDCVLPCATAMNSARCEECIGDVTGLSEGCRDCYVDGVDCGRENCIAECIGNLESRRCLSCQAMHCLSSWETCSGLDISDAVHGVCENEEDEAAHGVTDMIAVVKGCVIPCAQNPERAVCEACISDNSVLTPDCRGCYVDHIKCGIEFCILECIADSSSLECSECQVEHCIPSWVNCTGRASTLAAELAATGS